MTLRIRPARPGDAATLTALAMRSKAHWGYDEQFLDACRASLTVHGTCTDPTFVAERDGAVAGFYQLRGSEVEMFFVEPAWIGAGVGRAMWEHLLAQASALGIGEVAVLSDPNAEGFYRAMGAERHGEAPSDVFGASRMLPRLRARVPARKS